MSKFNQERIFTSESVCEGHPDKICDQISDLILDHLIKDDPNTRTGIEAVVGKNQISLFGEIKSNTAIDIEPLVRQKITELGYTNPDWGFSNQSNFNNYLHHQSQDIALGVDKGGAGDQGMMFGYACKQTEQYLPLPIALAHSITRRIDEVRKNNLINWLRPDGKAQVTIDFQGSKPKVLKLVTAVAHHEDIHLNEVKNTIIQEVLSPVLDQFKLELPNDKDIIVNGTGIWHIPGPKSDAGLTGRKIVVDTYGGYARVGGGAFSGKDPSKVDRSGAYAARYIAKNIVANGLADECEVGLAYVIGQAKPLMQTIQTFDTNHYDLKTIHEYKDKLIDTSVAGIIHELDLLKPHYLQTTTYGHFGKDNLPWEKIV